MEKTLSSTKGKRMSEWNAAEYACGSQLQEAMADEALALLDLKGVERVLDVGCGDGRITAGIAARVPGGSVTGVDPSPDMVNFASRHFASVTNLAFELGDARSLRYRNEFDLVVSFNALHWIPDQDKALASIRAAMLPGGRALIRLVPAGERKSLELVVEETRLAARWASFFRGFEDPYLRLSPEQYAEVAQRNGLRVLRLHTEDKTWDFGSRAAFFAFCSMGFGAWTRRLPTAEVPAFIDDVLDRYQRVTDDRPGDAKTFRFYQMDVTLVRGADTLP